MSNGYIRSKADPTWWIQQVRTGIDFRKKQARQDKWEEWRSMYRGRYRGDILPSNIYFKMLRTIVPRIYFRNPSVSVMATRPGPMHAAFAKLLERTDNKMIRQMKMKTAMKRLVQQGFMFGTGIGKLGFGAEFTPALPPGFSVTEPVGRNGEVFEYNSNIRDNMPWFNRVHTGSFVVPSGVDCMENSRWVAEWIRRPIDDVKGDPRLKNTADLRPTSRNSRFTSNDMPAPEKPGIKNYVDMVDLLEIRDKKHQQVIVLAPYMTDRILLQADDELQVDGTIPYYDIVFNEDDEFFWGIPDSVNLEPQQKELNEIRTQIMKHRRVAVAKILAKRKSMTEDEALKMVSEDVAPVIWLDGDVSDVREMQTGGIPSDLITAEQLVRADVRETVGFGRNQMGEYAEGSADRTAFEARVVQMASEIRVDERRDMMADTMVDVIGDMNKILFKHWDQEIVTDVTGPMGVQLWVAFTPSMLGQGQYEIKVDPDSSLPETKDVRERKAIEMYSILKENPFIDPMQLTSYLLHEVHGVAFDTMLRGMPPGAGSHQRPLTLEQYMQLIQQTRAAMPQQQQQQQQQQPNRGQ